MWPRSDEGGAKAGAEAGAEPEAAVEVVADGMTTNGEDPFQGMSQEKLEIRPHPPHLNPNQGQNDESVMKASRVVRQ